MTFVAYSNPTDVTRQTARYSTRTYERFLYNMTDWEIGANNIAGQFGDLTNLSIHGFEMDRLQCIPEQHLYVRHYPTVRLG